MNKITLRLLRWICPSDLREEIEGDLFQRFEKDFKVSGEKIARWKFLWNAVRFLRPGIFLRHQFSFRLNQPPMFRNYVIVAARHVRKNILNALFKVGGLTLALFSSLIICLYVFYQLSFDRYHEGFENIYRVNTTRMEDGEVARYGIAPLALGPMLHQRFPEIEAFTRIDISNGSHVRYQNKVVSCGVFPADSSLFDVFSFQFIQGEKRALVEPGSIVLTKTLALRIFGEEDPLNKVLSINNEPQLYQVTAVIEDMPPNSHFRVDAFVPIVREAGLTSNTIISPVEFVDQSCMLYIKFRPNVEPSSFSNKLMIFLEDHLSASELTETGFNIFLQPMGNIYFGDRYKYEFTNKGSLLYMYIFAALGVFLIVVAGINFINLSIADFTGRSREMGVRKVMGAAKRQIVLQMLVETVCYCCCAFFLSLILLYALFPMVLNVLEPNLTLRMLMEKQVVYAVSLTLLTLTILSTAFPAYLLSTSMVTNDLKGSGGHGYHARLGKILLVGQFVISAICISATLTIGNQLDYIHTKNLGFDRENLLVLLMPEDMSVKQMQYLKTEFKTIAGVESVSNSSFRIGGGYWKDWYTVEVDNEMKSVELYEVFSDDELFNTLGMKLLSGRVFNADYPADSGAAFVINETAAKVLGWEEPIGKRILTHPEEPGKWDGTVVGVVADINISSLHEKVQPLVMRLPWQNDYPEYFVYVRINGFASEAIEAIRRKYSSVFPDYPIDIAFVDDFYNAMYHQENRAFDTIQFGTLIITMVSVLGIFSLSVYMSFKRSREFGIRKVLGATVSQILVLHVGYFLRFGLLANVIAMPVSYWLMKGWLDGFAYNVGLNLFGFLSVICITFLLIIVSGGYSSWKAGRMNPVDVIKLQ